MKKLIVVAVVAISIIGISLLQPAYGQTFTYSGGNFAVAGIVQITPRLAGSSHFIDVKGTCMKPSTVRGSRIVNILYVSLYSSDGKLLKAVTTAGGTAREGSVSRSFGYRVPGAMSVKAIVGCSALVGNSWHNANPAARTNAISVR